MEAKILQNPSSRSNGQTVRKMPSSRVGTLKLSTCLSQCDGRQLVGCKHKIPRIHTLPPWQHRVLSPFPGQTQSQHLTPFAFTRGSLLWGLGPCNTRIKHQIYASLPPHTGIVFSRPTVFSPLLPWSPAPKQQNSTPHPTY